MTIEIKKIPFKDIVECGMSLKDKDNSWSLQRHAEAKKADIAVNGAMFSNGNPKTDPYYYWNIVDMVIDGKFNRGGNYSNKGIAFGKPFPGISAYPSTTENCIGKPVDFVAGAPTLIINGVINMDMKGLTDAFATQLTNHTAIGVDASNLYIATTRASHYTLKQVATALLNAGCKNAINKDGGVSTAYYEKKVGTKIDYYTQNRNITSAFYVVLKKVSATSTGKSVFIGVGHGGGDPGASFNKVNEKDVNLQISLACNNELVRHKVKTLLSRLVDEDDPLIDEIAECNKFNPTIAVDMHINAGKGDGVEFWAATKDTKSKVLAALLEKHILAIGQNSRGVKTKLNTSGTDYYGFNREVKCPNVIAESAFIDNLADFSIVDSIDEQKKFGVAYAQGILEYLNIPYIVPIIIPTIKCKVCTEYLADEVEAAKVQNILLAKGYDSTVIKEETK